LELYWSKSYVTSTIRPDERSRPSQSAMEQEKRKKSTKENKLLTDKHTPISERKSKTSLKTLKAHKSQTNDQGMHRIEPNEGFKCKPKVIQEHKLGTIQKTKQGVAQKTKKSKDDRMDIELSRCFLFLFNLWSQIISNVSDLFNSIFHHQWYIRAHFQWNRTA